MYQQKHIDIARRITSDRLPNVAFYGDKVVATDSYRLIEMPANGEAQDPVFYPANMLKAVKLGKGVETTDAYFGITPVEDTSFPKYQELKDKFEKEEYIEFAINGKYLAELADQLAKLSTTKKVIIGIPKKYADNKEVHLSGRPVRLQAADDSIAYVMPMKYDN